MGSRYYQYRAEERIYVTVGGKCWAYCIPFEGNEYLLGTAENPEK